MDGLVGFRNLLLVCSLSDLANDVVAEIGQRVDRSVALLTPTGGLTFGREEALVGELRVAACTNPNVGGVLLVGPTRSATQSLAVGLQSAGRLVETLALVEQADTARAITRGVELGTHLAERLSGAPRCEVGFDALRVALRSSSSSERSLTEVNPVVGTFVDVVVRHGGSVGFSEIADVAGAVERIAAMARYPEVAESIRAAVEASRNLLVSLKDRAPDPTPTNRFAGITSLEQKSLGALRRLGSSAIASVFAYGQRMPSGGLHMMLGPGSAAVSLAGLAAAGCNLLVYTVGATSITVRSPLMPTIKVAPASLQESRDVDLCIRDDRDVAALIEMSLRIADGAPSIAELSRAWPVLLPNYISRL